ncbi:MAG: RNA 2',3'-cyclic phosphodiesterase, partial [Flavobacteriales bacterium]
MMTSLFKDKKKRLFSGIEIPENIKSELTLLSTGITERANLRFVPPENMHITLQFYGNVPEEDIPDLKRHLEQASANTKPFELPFSKLLCFPEKKPRMIWA